MFTYRVRPRVLKLDASEALVLPADATVIFHMAPDQPFGCAPRDGRTTVRGVAASSYFNANTGQFYIQSVDPLKPLSADLGTEPVRAQLAGTTLTATLRIDSLNDLSGFIEGVYYVLPLLLAPDFGDPPIVVRVDGTIGTTPFRWELAEWRMEFTITTQNHQQDLVKAAWHRLALLDVRRHQCLVAALHYFHVATRLLRTSAGPGEFLAEALLNFSKVLEVLYQSSMDTVRRELPALGFTAEEVERDYVPVMALRNYLDVAHVSLTLFSPAQLAVLHRCADRSEAAFRKLLRAILSQLDQGILVLPPYELHGADERTFHILERLEAQFATLGDRP